SLLTLYFCLFTYCRWCPFHRRRVLFPVLDGDQLRQDADGDLLWGDRTDVEPDRRVHAAEDLGRHLIGGEGVGETRDLGAAADQTEIAQLARCQHAQRLEVVGVAARDDDGVGVRREIRAVDPRGDVVDDDLDRGRKALAVGELLAIV